MASVEIGEINLSKSQDCTSSSSCVIKVGYGLTMNEEDMPDLSSARIFRVPKPLRDSNDSWYSPQFVSIGPFHYGKEELKEMEKSKSEAVRRMQERIQQKDPQASIESIVEQRIKHKDKEIREFYGEHIPYGSEELAWMVTRDACFLFEFLVNYISKSQKSRGVYEEEVSKFSWKLNSVFDSNKESPMRERIMNDILLVENQIPLWILEELLHIKNGSTEGGNKSLEDLMDSLLRTTTSHGVFLWGLKSSYDSCSHFLDVLYHGMLGYNVIIYKYVEARALGSLCGNCMKLWFKKPSLPGNRIQLWFKTGVDLICWCKRSSNANPDESVQFVKLPSAVELTRAGVKISAVLEKDASKCEPGYSAIQWIRFDEKTSTLYLPQINVTVHSSLVMRSIIAMEVSTIERYAPMPMEASTIERYAPMPITMFSIFLDELIDNEEDVAVLRKAEVIKNHLGSNQQVADLFNSLPKGISYFPDCKVIDDVRRGLHKYTRRKYKILWSEFVSAYFSKPWLVAGSMAATLLLLMTVIQVFCLFSTCNV